MAASRTAGAEGPRWPWLSLIPLGLGAWAPIYAGVRAHRPRWSALGATCSVAVLAGWVLACASASTRGAGGAVLIVGWAGAIASSFAIRGEYARLLESPFQASVRSAAHRLANRDEALALAREQPALARELGVGRPDLPNAQHAGLIDINNAPAGVLATLPNVDKDLAARIVQARAAIHGFASVEDLGATLDLDANTVEDLRNRTVFLPR